MPSSAGADGAKKAINPNYDMLVLIRDEGRDASPDPRSDPTSTLRSRVGRSPESQERDHKRLGGHGQRLQTEGASYGKNHRDFSAVLALQRMVPVSNLLWRRRRQRMKARAFCLGVEDTERTIKALQGIEGKRLTYRRPDGAPHA